MSRHGTPLPLEPLVMQLAFRESYLSKSCMFSISQLFLQLIQSFRAYSNKSFLLSVGEGADMEDLDYAALESAALAAEKAERDA